MNTVATASAAARGSARRRDARRPATTRPVSRQQYALDVTPRRAVSCRLESWACGLLRKNVSQSGLPWRRLSLQQWYVHTKHSPSRQLISMSHVLLNYRPLTSNSFPLPPPLAPFAFFYRRYTLCHKIQRHLIFNNLYMTNLAIPTLTSHDWKQINFDHRWQGL